MKCKKCHGYGRVTFVDNAHSLSMGSKQCDKCKGDGLEKIPITPDELCVSGTEEEITKIARNEPMNRERMIHIIENRLQVMFDGAKVNPHGMRFQFDQWYIMFDHTSIVSPISECHEPISAWDELITTLGNGVIYPNQLKKWKKKYQSILESTYIPDEGANL